MKKFYKKPDDKPDKWSIKGSEINRTVRCRVCGNMYESEGIPSGACETCRMAREEQYQVVRAVVREYPGITALDVHEVTEVPMEVILRYIDKGLLEVVSTRNDKGEISERVGVMIKRAKERAKVILKQHDEIKLPIIEQLEEFKIEKEKFTWLGE